MAQHGLFGVLFLQQLNAKYDLGHFANARSFSVGIEKVVSVQLIAYVVDA
jgi:hypothetical protein